MENIKLAQSPYVRLAHSDLIKGEVRTNNKTKEEYTHYTTAFLVPMNKDTQAKVIVDLALKYKDHVMKAALAEKPKGSKLDNLFKDGNEVADAAVIAFKEENPKKEVPAYLSNTRNFWVCNAGTNYALKFFGPKGGETLDADWAENNVYDGCWCRIETRGYAWNFIEGKANKKGWSIGLAGSLQKWQDAEKFAGNSETEAAEETMEVSVPDVDADDFIN